VPVVSAPQVDEVRTVIEDACRKMDAPLIFVDLETVSPSYYIDGKQLFHIEGRHHQYDLRLPLLGTYQRVNAAVATVALETLIDRGVAGINKDSVERGLEKTDWPGRFQVLDRQPLIIVDGAHNPASAVEFVASLAAYLNGIGRLHPAVLVIGASSDKDVHGMAEVLTPAFDEVIVTHTRHPRAMDVAQLGRAFEARGMRVNYTSTVAEAIVLAVKMADPAGLVCVTGSLFAVGETLELWQTRH
jgi:dihydrofolate synthase/folylpolyglutamate synthase